MKKFIPIAIFVISFCSIGYIMITRGNNQMIPAPVMAAGVTPLPTATATETPIPTPAIDYNATSLAYQQDAIHSHETALAAIAANAAITAEFEQRVHDQLILTSQAEYINFQMMGWTATAAPTSIALTSTAQLVIFGNQTMQAGQMTATAKAPTLVVAMAQSQNIVENIKTDYIMSIIGKFVMMFGVIVLAIYLIWKMRTVTAADIMHELQKEEPQHAPADKIEFTLRDEKTPGKSEHRTLPCTLDQLMELAEMVVNGTRSFPYNQMEQESRTFKGQRETLRAVRDVLNAAGLVITSPRTGEGMVDSRGVAFFEYVFEANQLPDGYDLPYPTDENV